MARRDEQLLTCEQVRQQVLPLLLRTVSERERNDVANHTAACEGCRLALDAERGRLGKIVELPSLELPQQLRSPSRHRRRWWLALLPTIPAVIAYALLIQQGIKVARYRYERRFVARLEKALYLYREDFGHFPPANGAPLGAVLGTHQHGGPYLDLVKERRDGVGHFVDHWGNRYLYVSPGEHNPRLFDIVSQGANGRDDRGAGDDITNWESGWERIPIGQD